MIPATMLEFLFQSFHGIDFLVFILIHFVDLLVQLTKYVQFDFFKPDTKIIKSWQQWMLLRKAKAFTFLIWRS